MSGPTDRVVVIGAGLGGLGLALRLAGAGRNVTVLERTDLPGGRAGRLSDRGYAFDTGPTVLTMPGLLADTFAAVGEQLSDRLELIALDPVYRARFADGSVLDVRSDRGAMAEEVAAFAGPREAAGYQRFVDHVTRLYQLEMPHFIDRNLDSPLDLVRPQLAALVRLGGLRKLAALVADFFADPRLQRVFSFQAMYAGLSPYEALAIYAVISYMDTVAGVTFPKGGMHAVPRAMADAATAHGVAIRYGTGVTRIELAGGRAVAVHTADGERIPADVVAVNADLPVAYRELLPPEYAPARLGRLHYSPSAFVLLAGSRAVYPDPAHHTILFGDSWRGVFRELIDEHRLMTDPSLLLTTPTATDPSLAPAGRQSYYVLAPTPNLDARLDWSVLAGRYRDEVVQTLERRGYPGFGDGIEVEHLTTPADWRARGMERGAPFAASHTFFQTGPFRPGNLAPGLENLVFVGSGTQPGVGVPMVLISARLAAERILGPAGRGRRRTAA